MANFEESWWVWLAMVIFLVYVLFLNAISWISAFGWFRIPTSIPNSGFFDPTTFKWFFLIGAIIAVAFLLYSLLVGMVHNRNKSILNQSTSTWHYFLATFFLTILTIAMWIADGKYNNLTVAGGFGELAPPFTGVPLPYAANNQLQHYTYDMWNNILVIAVMFTSFIIISTYNGYRSIMFINAFKTGTVSPQPPPEEVRGNRKKKSQLNASLLGLGSK